MQRFKRETQSCGNLQNSQSRGLAVVLPLDFLKQSTAEVKRSVSSFPRKRQVCPSFEPYSLKRKHFFRCLNNGCTMRRVISAHWVSPATAYTRPKRLRPRATTAGRLRASRNCCAATRARQRIQRGKMIRLIRRPLRPPSSPTHCREELQHRFIIIIMCLF